MLLNLQKEGNVRVEGKRLNWLMGHVPKRFADDILKVQAGWKHVHALVEGILGGISWSPIFTFNI